MSSEPVSGISSSSVLDQLLGRARELIDQGHFAEAIAPLTDAVAINPDAAGVLANLGGLYVEIDSAEAPDGDLWGWIMPPSD